MRLRYFRTEKRFHRIHYIVTLRELETPNGFFGKSDYPSCGISSGIALFAKTQSIFRERYTIVFFQCMQWTTLTSLHVALWNSPFVGNTLSATLYLSHFRAANVQMSLCKSTVWSETSLLSYSKYNSKVLWL